MERKILEHITKTIGDIEPKKWESILELYGPLSYKEYDEIVEFIKYKRELKCQQKIFGGTHIKR